MGNTVPLVCKFSPAASAVVLPTSPWCECPPGMFCPNISKGVWASVRNLTCPSACPPTEACARERLQGKYCEPQGIYEPVLCPAGSFCPNSSLMFPCPEGHFCPKGSPAPYECPPMSICPPSTEMRVFYGGVVGFAILDVLIVVIVLLHGLCWRPRVLKLREQRAKAAGGLLRENGTTAMPTGAQETWWVLSSVCGFGSGCHEARRRLASAADAPVGSSGRASAGSVADGDYHPALGGLDDADDAADEAKLGVSRAALVPSGDSRERGAMLSLNGGSGRAGKRERLLVGGAGEDGAEFTAGNSRVERARRVLVEAFTSANKGCQLEIEFKDLQWATPAGRVILHGVSGSISPGRFTAIMGPSGAGKTTLLSVLLGKNKRSAGTLRIGGVEAEPTQYKKLFGFVPQDDVLLPELTVRENVAFSARMRLPRSGWDEARVQRHVDAIVDSLGLTEVADSLVGDASRRGISGGQKKRCSIGLELAAAPCVLLLDEPTSGLDSSAALEVCETLRMVANLGITVVAVIHQPRVEIFEQIDDLVLLEPGGRVAFQGPQQAAVPYFSETCGMVVPPSHNPADVMLDLVSGKQQRPRGRECAGECADAGGAVSEAGIELGASAHGAATRPPREAGEAFVASAVWVREGGAAWVRTWEEANGAVPVGDLAPGALSADKAERDLAKELIAGRGASFVRQLWLCLRRAFLQQYRLIPALALEMGVAVLAGTAMGASVGRLPELYNGVLKLPFTAISPSPLPTIIPSLGMYIALAVGVSAAPAGVMTFGEERLTYFREASAGHNRLAYFVAKNLASLPRVAADGLHFTALFVVFAHPFTSFGELYSIVVLEYLAVYGLSAMMGMVVPRENAALLAVIVAIIAGVLCGFGPSIVQGRTWGIGWLQDTSYARWGNEAFFTMETKPYRALFMVDEVSAPFWGYTLDRVALDLFFMFAIAMAYRAVAFVLMVCLNRRKQL